MLFFIQSSPTIIGICVLFTISILAYNNTFQILIFHEIEGSILDQNGSLNIQQNQPLQQQPLQQQPLQQQNQPLDDNLIIGSFGNDRITGTPKDDIIVALSGSDTVHGLSGNDKIQGNEETDQLYGDAGDDIVQGGSGSDLLHGEENNDVLAGGVDDDYLIGGIGNDKLYGDVGDDILSGLAGADYFDCGDGVDVIIDFSLNESDDTAGNCEEIQNN
jgi:Ca2+-binding RTX toxin-like protein